MPFVPAKGRTRGGASTPRMTVPSTPPRPPASPKFQLPPTTVSPQATRLDRVLDLVTSHEANLAENELKVLDLTKRVAQAEDASRGRRDEDRRARAAEDAALRAELASVKDAVKRVEGAIALWSGDTDGIKHEVRDLVSKCRDDSNAELSETKLGFKAVLQDVVDKVAAQLDAVRRDAVATRHNYANADEVAALHEKIDAFESRRADARGAPQGDDERDAGRDGEDEASHAEARGVLQRARGRATGGAKRRGTGESCISECILRDG